MKKEFPNWSIPKNITEIIAEEEMWEDERWRPMLLTIIGGTVYKGRAIPLSWQIEFEPSDDECADSNQKLSALGLKPDGYGWATLIGSIAAKYHPEIKNELQFGDTEESTLVVWVESEKACKTLMELLWNVIYAQ